MCAYIKYLRVCVYMYQLVPCLPIAGELKMILKVPSNLFMKWEENILVFCFLLATRMSSLQNQG